MRASIKQTLKTEATRPYVYSCLHRGCIFSKANLSEVRQRECDLEKALTDLRLLLSLSRSSETTSKSEAMDTRSGSLAVPAAALAMVSAAGTSIAARPVWLGAATKQTHGARRLGAGRAAQRRQRQAASRPKSTTFLLMCILGELTDSISTEQARPPISKNLGSNDAG